MIHFAPECCCLASIHGLFTVYSRSILSTYLLYFLIFTILENKRIKYIVNVKQKLLYYYQGSKFIHALYRIFILDIHKPALFVPKSCIGNSCVFVNRL